MCVCVPFRVVNWVYARDIRRNMVNACAGHVQGDTNAALFHTKEQIIQASKPGKTVPNDWGQGVDLSSQRIVCLFEILLHNGILPLREHGFEMRLDIVSLVSEEVEL